MSQNISITHRSFLALAIPFVFSMMTQPLLGAVDTAVIGRLDDPAYIGGVAIGAVIFNTMYWLVGFLRIGTSGFSAQSLGSRDEDDRYLAYYRPMLIALCISLAFLLLKNPILAAALRLYDPNPQVVPHIHTYYDIVIWGAPLVLTGMVNLGWLIGRKLVRETLILQISSNLLNIVLDIVFVLGLEMGVTGVALATLIAQAYGFVLGFFIISRKLDLMKVQRLWGELLSRASMIRIMKVNSDLMIRTVCLLIMTNMFFAKGSELGVDLLAVNAVLFQVQYIIAYLFDGMADAARIFAGKSYQEKNPAEFDRIYQVLTLHTTVLSILMAGCVLLCGGYIIPVFTDLERIITLSNEYLPWLVVFPLTIGFGLTYYGVYTGVTHTSTVRNSHTAAVLVFIASYYTLIPIWGNHGLWLAFILFSLTRSLYLILHTKHLKRALFGEHSTS